MRGALIIVLLVTVYGCGARETTTRPAGPQPFGGSGSVAHAGAGAGGMAGDAVVAVETVTATPPASMPRGPITAVAESDGCGRDLIEPSGTTFALLTQGEKAGDCADRYEREPVCGVWQARRIYTVWLPEAYDRTRAYPLVIEAPDCGGQSRDVYPLEHSVGNTVIRVGIAPGPNSTGHASKPGEGCFDDEEGEDSIDWIFYESLYDRLNADLCFDRNRVFALGTRSGAKLANELSCKYAGDPLRPIRGVGAIQGALPTDPASAPTCSTAPLSGFWLHEMLDDVWPFESAKVAIDRAMALDGCTLGRTYETATFQNFPIRDGVPEEWCHRIQGCDAVYPLVVCPLPGNQQGSPDFQVNVGFSAFVKLFSSGPLLTR